MGGLFEIYVKTHFSAAHRLCGYAGDCARVHGHNWVVEAFVKCCRLNEIGIGVDFRDVKTALRDVLSRMDHRDLNELTEFSRTNPTSENVAKFIYQELSTILNDQAVKVSMIKVSETPGAGAAYWEE